MQLAVPVVVKLEKKTKIHRFTAASFTCESHDAIMTWFEESWRPRGGLDCVTSQIVSNAGVNTASTGTLACWGYLFSMLTSADVSATPYIFYLMLKRLLLHILLIIVVHFFEFLQDNSFKVPLQEDIFMGKKWLNCENTDCFWFLIYFFLI